MNHQSNALSVAIAALVLMAPAAQQQAQAAARSGKEVVEAVCAACHASGTNGAPRIGDEKAWGPRAALGLSSLTRYAIQGIRQMPPHGGNPGLSDFELELAITYMVNQSGGQWAVPVDKAALPAARSGEQIVRAQCVKCHGSGLDGAPKIGDRTAWIPRARYGLDALVRSAIEGHGGMPSRGGMADLTDPELRSAIVYMLDQKTVPVKAQGAPSAPAAQPGWDHKVVEGVEIYLGVIPAETLRALHPKPHAESTMHGGIPRGKGYYHLNVSLYDSTSKAAIKDAEVTATLMDPVSGTETKKLEPMAFPNAVSYDKYFRIVGAGPHTVTVRIKRPGTILPITARFDLQH